MTESAESSLVVQALRLNTLSKLTFADSRRFDALVADVFAGVQLQSVENPALKQALQESAAELNLEMNEAQIGKSFQLFEQLRQRMGVVIVGPSGVGKSTLWKLLRAGMMKTGQQVKIYTVNPKAMPRNQAKN